MCIYIYICIYTPPLLLSSPGFPFPVSALRIQQSNKRTRSHALFQPQPCRCRHPPRRARRPSASTTRSRHRRRRRWHEGRGATGRGLMDWKRAGALDFTATHDCSRFCHSRRSRPRRLRRRTTRSRSRRTRRWRASSTSACRPRTSRSSRSRASRPPRASSA